MKNIYIILNNKIQSLTSDSYQAIWPKATF